MLRHFAFFSTTVERMVDGDGRAFEGCRCMREIKGDFPEPWALTQSLPASLRTLALNIWQRRVSGQLSNEICLDVTSFDYPAGDFCWMIFRPYDQTEPGKVGLLDWPFAHLFAEIDRATLRLHAYVTSPRPVRDDDRNIVIDITGTPFEQFVRTQGCVYGTVVTIGGAVQLTVDKVSTPLRRISAASSDLDVFIPAHRETVPVHAGVSR